MDRPQADAFMSIKAHDGKTLFRDHDILYLYHNRIDNIGDKLASGDRVAFGSGVRSTRMVKCRTRRSVAPDWAGDHATLIFFGGGPQTVLVSNADLSDLRLACSVFAATGKASGKEGGQLSFAASPNPICRQSKSRHSKNGYLGYLLDLRMTA